jgi:tetratricopeptide (TPR) repeat protein
MKKHHERFQLLLLIILPLFISFALDLQPFSRSTQKVWMALISTNQSKDEKNWVNNTKLILRYQPWQIELWELLSQNQFQNEEYSDVITSLGVFSEYMDLSIDQKIRKSQSYFQLGEFEKSKDINNLVLSEPSMKSEQLEKLYRIQLELDDWAGGYKTISKWYEIDPDNPFVLKHFTLQQILFEPQKAIESIENNNLVEFQEVMDDLELIIATDNITYQSVLAGIIFSQLNEWEFAKKAFERVTELDPEYAEGWAFLGNSLNKNGENGYFALDKALKLSPSSKITRAFLASYWRDQLDYLKSVEIYQTLIEEEKEEPVWYQELGNTYIQMGDLDAAFGAFLTTTALAPDIPYYWLNLARFSGEYRYEIKSIGISAARHALLIDDQNWEVNDLLGWLYILESDFTTAERFLSRAYQSKPDSPIVNLHLGQLYSLQNRASLANYYLEKCIRKTTDEEIIDLANKFLLP